MQEKLAELQLFADAFEVPLDMQSFSKRLLVQKKIYLLQELGIDLGFRYGWYIRGPYCPILTKLAYELEEHPEYRQQINGSYELTEEAQQQVEALSRRYHQMIDDFPGNSEEDKAELLVSIHYLRKREMQSNKLEEVIGELLHRKDWYTEEQARIAWQRLVDQGLVQ